MSIDTPPITPQQYEVLHGGGAEAAEIAKQRLSRRRFLRRSMLAVWGLATTASVAGALYFMYPNLAGQFGSDLTVGTKNQFPAALPKDFKIGQAGVTYVQAAKTYLTTVSASSVPVTVRIITLMESTSMDRLQGAWIVSQCPSVDQM